MHTLSDVIGPILAPFATLFTNPTRAEGPNPAGGRDSGHGPARRSRSRTKQRRHPHRGARVPDRRLVSLGQIGRPHPLSAGPNPEDACCPRYLPCTRLSADLIQILEWFCPALAIGGHLPGSTDRSGPGDQEPVIQPGHRPYHAHPAGPLLLDHPGRSPFAKTSSHHSAHRRRVRQTVADLRLCHRPGTKPPVAGLGRFSTFRSQHRYAELPATRYHRVVDSPRLCRLNCAKSSLGLPSVGGGIHTTVRHSPGQLR